MEKNGWNYRLLILLIFILPMMVNCRRMNYAIYEFSDDMELLPTMGPTKEAMHISIKKDSMYLDYSHFYSKVDFHAVYRNIDSKDAIWTYSLVRYESNSRALFDMDTVWVEFHRDSLLLWLPGNTFCKDKDRFWLSRDRD